MAEDMLLEVNHVTKTFPVSKGFFSGSALSLKAVDDVSFQLEKGATMGLVGESGCGKSTMARLILCLDRPDQGEVVFKGKNIYDLSGAELKDFRKKVQIVFQDPFSSLNPRKRVGSIIGEPLIIHKLVPRHQVKEKVMALMTRVGLQEDAFNRFPHEFSSGQRQRIGIARALSLGPELIVADEPVSALDVSIQAQTINLLMDLQEQMQLTYLFISHDLNVVRFMSATVAVMYLGKIVETAPSAELYESPVHPYTEALLSAVPNTDPAVKKERILLQGEIPSPLSPPEGCVFSSRCPIAEPSICFKQHPPLEQKRDSHWAACFLRQ